MACNYDSCQDCLTSNLNNLTTTTCIFLHAQGSCIEHITSPPMSLSGVVIHGSDPAACTSLAPHEGNVVARFTAPVLFLAAVLITSIAVLALSIAGHILGKVLRRKPRQVTEDSGFMPAIDDGTHFSAL